MYERATHSRGTTRDTTIVSPIVRCMCGAKVLPTDLDTGKLTVIDNTRKSVDGSKKQTFTDFEYNKIFAPEATQAEVHTH